jgi:tRNA(Ile)-lysidine synthase
VHVGAPDGDRIARFRNDVERLIARAFDGATLAPDAHLALAVSGGPDSMAMLALAAATFPARVIAATFDHRLRDGSATEAQMVATACAALGVPHRVLVSPEAIAGSSIQARAREARYAGLTDWASSAGAVALLTAHHADDQAETLLMRLNRASGIAGLAAIRAWRFDGDVAVLRPLLGWRRTELRATVAASELPFVDDPSNDDLRHDRTRIRALLAANPALDPVALATSATHLGEAEEVLHVEATTLWEDRWHGPERPFVLHDLPRELQRRLLRRAIVETRRALGIVLPPFPAGSNVEAVLDSVMARRTTTLGGVMIVRQRDGSVFRPAPPRRSH